MKSFNVQFKDKKTLANYIKTNNISKEKNILVQIFTGVVDEDSILEVSRYIKKLLPYSNIIGVTTAGEIYDGKMYEKTIVLSFSIFKYTSIKSKLIDFNEATNVQDILPELISNETKALIVFSDRLQSNAEDLLNKITLSYPNIIIAGGRAGYDVNLKKTLVFDENRCLENACVIASLSSDKLIVNSDYMLNWTQIGKNMIVTKAKDNIVYEVDGIKIQKLYEKYLGKDVSNHLPLAGVEFPLITEKNGVQIARVPISVEKDGSLLLSGTFNVGDKIRFSYANICNITNVIYDNYSKFKEYPSEAIFIYSCVGRKNLIGKELESEFKMLNSMATTAGFFTHGEYFHSLKNNELLNMSTTFLTLSETSKLKQRELFSDEIIPTSSILKALSNLTEITTKELEHKNRELQRLSDITSRLVLYTTSDLKGNITSVSKAYEKFTNLKASELVGQNHNIFRHEDTPDDFYDVMWKTLDNDERFVGEIRHKIDKYHNCWIKLTIEPLFDEDKNKIGYSSYREDITEKKRLEFVSSHDTLTSLYNRGEFIKVIDIKINSMKRYGGTFGFVIFDIDHFKNVNDTYGHKVGDDVLVKLGKFISSNIRADDFVARWGGEEFIIIVNNSNIDKLVEFIKKLQMRLSKISFAPINNLTVSFGLTEYRDGDSKDSILNRADMALYNAKENGRNRYEIN